MDQRKPQENQEKKKFEWTYIEIIFCIAAALTVFMPLLLTRSSGLPSFRETGPIGDTIGGTTAPFIGLLSAWLVYRALKAQIDANSLIITQFEHQKKSDQANKIVSTLTDQIKILREDIKDFKFSWYDELYHPRHSEGSAAIESVLESYPLRHVEEKSIIKSHETSIFQLLFFLQSMEYILDTLERSEIEEIDKYYLRRLVEEIFTIKFLLQIHSYEYKMISKQPPCKSCNKQHGITDDIFTTAGKIADKCFVGN